MIRKRSREVGGEERLVWDIRLGHGVGGRDTLESTHTKGRGGAHYGVTGTA